MGQPPSIVPPFESILLMKFAILFLKSKHDKILPRKHVDKIIFRKPYSPLKENIFLIDTRPINFLQNSLPTLFSILKQGKVRLMIQSTRLKNMSSVNKGQTLSITLPIMLHLLSNKDPMIFMFVISACCA